ncbi:MAG: HAMP domain-containing histidine kinase [Chloroflexi bacterium]|nr:HAMP domain-containing histidine kinase [Chloroflexota bacterium]
MVNMERALESGEVGPAPTPPIDARLIGQIAHELRTPLASLRVAYELFTDKSAIDALAANPKQKDRLMNNMGRSIDRLEQQVSDLLDIGYLQSNSLTLKLTSVSAVALIASACERTSGLSERRSQFVDIKLGDDVPDILADHDRMEQVMVYLLSYLMRVTPVGETLSAVAVAESGMLNLALKGGGRQISFDERERLFEPFFRLRGEGGQVQDSGLGLAISRSLVELHGGRVWLESPVNGGNTFQLSLPIGEDNSQPPYLLHQAFGNRPVKAIGRTLLATQFQSCNRLPLKTSPWRPGPQLSKRRWGRPPRSSG